MSIISNEKLLSMKTYAKSNVGPVVFSYVEWVLKEAEERGIKRLYFLARDGFVLFEAAKKIVSVHNLDVDCRYLYCSRQALRMPSYHIIGEEAFDLLTLGGFYLTPRSVLSRAMISEEKMTALYEELGVTDPDRSFSESEFAVFSNKLRASENYRTLVLENSRRAYALTIEYFRKEGLFDTETVAIVDSGWTGSMQRSLRQLMRNEGYSGKLVGFYFGMYVSPKSGEDGEYLNFYFDSKKGFWRKTFFNNNLFECMLSAPHAMTVGYEKNGENVVPTFAPGHSEELTALIEKQIEGALEYVEENAKELAPSQTKKKRLVKKCRKILKRAMVYPSAKEAELLSSFMFCDDVTEGYKNSIADKRMREKLSNYNLFLRVWRKLTGKKNPGTSEIFWVYGVIAFCPPISRPWHRLNVILWDILKRIMKK